MDLATRSDVGQGQDKGIRRGPAGPGDALFRNGQTSALPSPRDVTAASCRCCSCGRGHTRLGGGRADEEDALPEEWRRCARPLQGSMPSAMLLPPHPRLAMRCSSPRAGRRASHGARVARRGGEGEPDGQRWLAPLLVTRRPTHLAHPTLVLVCAHRVAALVEEMLSSLREEVKEMDRTNWLYETQDPQVGARVKI